ncbi:hypothetical protein HY950_02255 [Candidatus Gottesmanbacteria bacterium]|nr:hypothetical protein [Candidatus Gottesmanbacteria bacterium]
MPPPPTETKTILLAAGETHTLDGLVVQRTSDGFLLTGPTGFDEQPRTDSVAGKSFSIGQDVFLAPGGEAVRQITIFQAR